MISVCLCSCNGASYIQAQLLSILGQLGPEDEIVVSDDASTDATLSLVYALSDSRVRVFENSQRRGVIRNFEAALQLCRGDYIFLADQDDLWEAEKIKRVSEALAEADLVLHDASVVNAQGQEILPSLFMLLHSRPGLLKNILKNSYVGCCMAFRRSLLVWALPFPVGVPMHDVWLGCVAEMIGRVRFLPDPLLHYRRHGDNQTALLERSQRTLWQKIAGRSVLVGHLLMRYSKTRSV